MKGVFEMDEPRIELFLTSEIAQAVRFNNFTAPEASGLNFTSINNLLLGEVVAVENPSVSVPGCRGTEIGIATMAVVIGNNPENELIDLLDAHTGNLISMSSGWSEVPETETIGRVIRTQVPVNLGGLSVRSAESILNIIGRKPTVHAEPESPETIGLRTVCHYYSQLPDLRHWKIAQSYRNNHPDWQDRQVSLSS